MFFYKPRRPSLFRARMPRGLGFIRGHSVSLKHRIIPTPSRAKQMLGLYPSQAFHRSLRRSSRRTKSSQDDYFDRIIAKGHIRKALSNGVFLCKYCGSDSWAVVKRTLLFWSTDMIYCEICKKVNLGLDRKKFFSTIKLS